MPGTGWTKGESDQSEAMFSFKYLKGDRSLVIDLDAGESVGQTNLVLSSGEPSKFLPPMGDL
jgi:hypothetical protein